ncbi:plasmid stabilization protein [Sulfurimonas lithotrophica]|uniref:Plasmid stabilization protein n=1 Tax=Sulfurimonas lithotrophica TaxID=2590022 RepID=A0A5P8P3W3_9BACT|nr:type II toxin-antitoxin system RelE/ParE family toxin [Sulfurimonas lithotrophica]QFR50301.1 plasmid stabilization protein [Sulfurimonas lithotrophica]
MNIKYSEKSLKDLKSFSHPDRILIVKKIHYLAENFDALKTSKKVTELKGSEFENQYRFVVAKKIRVLFRIEEDEIILLVLRVGFRKSIY